MRVIKKNVDMLLLALLAGALHFGCSHDGGTTKGRRAPEDALGKGKLIGRIMRGPRLPVERKDDQLSFEPASGASLLILDSEGQVVERVITNEDGRFSVPLPAGTYRIEMLPLAGGEWSKDLPATVIINEGQEVQVDIRIDTGIR